MNPLAVYNAMYYDQRIKGTTMIIDLGAENTDLIIAEGESIWLRSIPIGGNNFTEALVKAFKLKFEKAEDLKRNAATSKYAPADPPGDAPGVRRPGRRDPAVDRLLRLGPPRLAHPAGPRAGRHVPAAGPAEVPAAEPAARRRAARQPRRRRRRPTPEAAATFNENLLSCVSAYGLALQAMGEGKINSSLLPLPIRRARMWRDKTKWFGAAAAVFLLGLVGVPVARYYYEDYQLSRAKETYDGQITQAIHEAEGLDREYEAVANIGGPEREKIKSINGLLQYRDLWPKLLKDIDSAMPDPGPDVMSGDPEKIKKIPARQAQATGRRALQRRLPLRPAHHPGDERRRAEKPDRVGLGLHRRHVGPRRRRVRPHDGDVRHARHDGRLWHARHDARRHARHDARDGRRLPRDGRRLPGHGRLPGDARHARRGKAPAPTAASTSTRRRAAKARNAAGSSSPSAARRLTRTTPPSPPRRRRTC